jgi:antitoxin (DNA-binding transcriptional repressor) of toxin-antitoxin stability system
MESADQGRTSAKLVAKRREDMRKYIAASKRRLNELDQQRAARDRLRQT